MTATNIFYNFVGFRYSPPQHACESLGGKPEGRSESGGRQFAACCGGSPFSSVGKGRIVDRSRAAPRRDLSESAPVDNNCKNQLLHLEYIYLRVVPKGK